MVALEPVGGENVALVVARGIVAESVRNYIGSVSTKIIVAINHTVI